jgi:hypothetical protein
MNKDLHNIDDIFNSAHREFEEEPSSDVWNKINAGLDKKDAESYKRRFIGWKRVSILSLLLLAGFILYESGIVKTSSGNSTDNATRKKEDIPVTPEKKSESLNQNQISSANRRTDGPAFDRKEEGISNIDFDAANATIKKKSSATVERGKIETTITVSGIDKKTDPYSFDPRKHV